MVAGPGVRLQVWELGELLGASWVSALVRLVACVSPNVLLEMRQLGELSLTNLTPERKGTIALFTLNHYHYTLSFSYKKLFKISALLRFLKSWPYWASKFLNLFQDLSLSFLIFVLCEAEVSYLIYCLEFFSLSFLNFHKLEPHEFLKNFLIFSCFEPQFLIKSFL